jgi:hypothetical protein
MMRWKFALILWAGSIVTVFAAEPNPQKLDYFEKKVRPILVNHCFACHSAETKPAGGLRVDDRNGLLTGGNSGASVVPGKSNDSLLLKRIAKEAKRRMPLEGEHLNDEQISVLKKWIDDGATWPSVVVPSGVGQLKPKYEQLKKEHWAWQPLSNPAVPAVVNALWARSEVDRFVLAKLESSNLQPVRDADKLELIRRLSFDLVGLPPTPAEVDRFLADNSADSVEKLVDRLLASPAYGEHWGRHWLDVARYGESTGPSRNIPYPHAWRYRDYVLNSINADVPFNRFIQEQIAGDLLPASTDEEKNRLKIATGYLAIGVKDVNQRFKVRFLMDNIDEQIDVVTRSTLALTVSCARCHDHKFDPIPQTDYYAVAGIFTSTENASGLRNQMGGAGLAYYVPDQLVRLGGTLPPAPAETVEKLKVEVAEAKKAWDAIRGTPEGLKLAPNGQPTQRPFRLKYEQLQGELFALTDPAQRGLAAHGVRDAKQISDTELRVRGEAEKLGPAVPRGYLTTFKVPDAKPINTQQSGRRELADWITSPQNPLTARVYVNRVWSYLFGRGLVSTVDNFGVTGAQPTHSELLDFLATRFIQEGWSTKKLIRDLVLTRTYQLSADSTAQHKKIDPSNSLHWRHSPRRLNAEEFRDGVLASAGKLELKRPEGTIAKEFKMIELRDNGPEAKRIYEAADKSMNRSVYLPLLRGLTPRALEAFDPVEQTLVTGTRDETTVPTQALFLLNSTFVRKVSLSLAERILEGSKPEAERVKTAYRQVLNREPNELETNRALGFLGEYESLSRQEFATAKPVTAKLDKPNSKPKKTDEPPLDPDQIDQTGEPLAEEAVQPKDVRTAAWLAFVQSLYGSAEFRFLK